MKSSKVLPLSERIIRMADARVAEREAEIRFIERTLILDTVTIALGRMGNREAFFGKFIKELETAWSDYAELGLKDIKDDDEMWLTHATMDKELKSYVGKYFVPYDKRYTMEEKK